MALEKRRLGKTGFEVCSVGMGCWQIGGCWSSADESATQRAALNAYLDAGGNFLDTANVYGGPYGTERFGWSEKTIREVLAERRAAGKEDGRVYIATKAGRAPTKAAPGEHGPERYTYEALSESLASSAERLGVECVDLLQLHCPPTEVLKEGSEAFAALRRLKEEGRILHWGVSVETLEEASLAIAQPDCATVQLIFNMLRLRPLTAGFLPAAKAADVGTLIRLPLASGLLTGKVDAAYVAALDDADHRKFNAAGEHFDKGETWSGLGEHLEDVALPAVARIKAAHEAALAKGEVPEGTSLAQAALRWALDREGASCVIPGARTEAQARGNLGAARLGPLPEALDGEVRRVYEELVRGVVERERW